MPKYFYIVYLGILLFALIAGCVHYRKMDWPNRFLVVYLATTFLVEFVAIAMALTQESPNTLFLYHVYSPVQFVMLCIYFAYSDKQRRIRKFGWALGVFGAIVSMLNTIYLQPITELNTNFIVLESFLIIGMSLFSFYKLLAGDIIEIHLNPRFWFSSIFLVFWSFTFFYWLVGVGIYKLMPDKTVWLNGMILFISVAAYLGFSIVFLSYKKMKLA